MLESNNTYAAAQHCGGTRGGSGGGPSGKDPAMGLGPSLGSALPPARRHGRVCLQGHSLPVRIGLGSDYCPELNHGSGCSVSWSLAGRRGPKHRRRLNGSVPAPRLVACASASGRGAREKAVPLRVLLAAPSREGSVHLRAAGEYGSGLTELRPLVTSARLRSHRACCLVTGGPGSAGLTSFPPSPLRGLLISPLTACLSWACMGGHGRTLSGPAPIPVLCRVTVTPGPGSVARVGGSERRGH